MSLGQRQRRLIVAMKHCIEATFTDNEWSELATLTDSDNTVFRHPRLLRSYSFGDDDYDFHIQHVLQSMIESDPANQRVIVDYLDLTSWLKSEDFQEYVALFGHSQLLIEELQNRSISNSFDVNQYVLRIQDSVDTDPELAIGSMKELLESLMKTILSQSWVTVTGKEDLPELLKKTQKTLKLDPAEFDTRAKGGNLIKRTLSNLGQIVTGISELRNLYGSGHGRPGPSGVTSRHARLVVNAGAALAVFLIETFEHHQKDSSKNSENVR